MRNKLGVMVVFMLMMTSTLFGQVESRESIPVYQGKILRVISDGVLHAIDENLLFLDSTHCINALFMVKFRIDSLGNVVNVGFSNDNSLEPEQTLDYGFDISVKNKLNQDIDSVLRKSSGKWLPAKKNGIPCLSKPFVIVISCERNKSKKCIERASGLNRIGNIPIFKGEEECILLTSILWLGDYAAHS